MMFYSVKLKKKVNIPEKNVTYKMRKGRRFAVGKYKVDGKTYEAWKTVSMKK